MIYESYPWKRDLLRRKWLIQKYNRSELLEKDDERAYTVIEKSIFYSAFIIRKLIDCKNKASDEVDGYRFTVKGFPPKKEIDLLHRWHDDDSHSWDTETSYTKSGAEICNWLIHSCIFFVDLDESYTIDSFYVSSDYNRNKLLYRVDLKDWIAYMKFVGDDYIVSTHMVGDEGKRDFVYKKGARKAARRLGGL